MLNIISNITSSTNNTTISNSNSRTSSFSSNFSNSNLVCLLPSLNFSLLFSIQLFGMNHTGTPSTRKKLSTVSSHS